MRALRQTARVLAGLFVEDKFLAAAIAAFAGASWLLQANGAGSTISGLVLFLGCLAAVVLSALSARKQR